MTSTSLRLAAASLAALLLGTAAHAAPISWAYRSRGPRAVHATDPSAGRITFSDEPGASVSGSSDVVAANLRAFSCSGPTTPATFSNAGYSVDLDVTDEASGQSGTLTFTGELSGELSRRSSNLTNTFTGLTTQALTLGANLYTVTVGPFSPPGPPTSGNAGSIGARVTVTSALPVQHSPEPATLLMLGLGLPGGAWLAWRSRRK